MVLYLVLEAGVWVIKTAVGGIWSLFRTSPATTERQLIEQNNRMIESFSKIYDDNIEMVETIERLERENNELKKRLN